MKKILSVVFATALICSAVTAQEPDKYTRTMQTNVPMVDTVRNTAQLIALSGTFERIAEAEKTKWLPYYYAALTQVQAAYFLGEKEMNADKTDPLADKAEAFITKADALNPNNSEIYVVKKMVASLRMMGDPMARWQQYGPMAEEALQIAMKLNPENPRIYLLQGQDKFYTPEQFGGSKEEAKKLFAVAQQKYETFKPASPIDPQWGRPAVDYFLAEASK